MIPQQLQPLYKRTLRFLYLCRLHRPADIPLFLLPGLWAAVMAAQGMPQLLPLTLLLLAALLVRCAAWVFNDWMEPRLLDEAPESFVGQKIVSPLEAQRLLAGLLLAALVLLLPLGLPLLYFAVPALFALVGFPFVKTRLFLTQPYLGLCFAWLVPMAWVSQGAVPDRTAWLLFTATLLWATGAATLHAIPRRNYELRTGIRSLAQLFGEFTPLFILAVQLLAILALWLAGRQHPLGIFFDIGLVTALLLLPYQQWLLLRQPPEGAMASYRAQTATAVAILCGTVFHYICLAQ
ncbi:MAG: UbiA family prenyltransferase [Pseudomonadota bacterium]